MDKKPLIARFATWGALLAVIVILSIETRGAVFGYLRNPLVLGAVAVATAGGIYTAVSRRGRALPAKPAEAQGGVPLVNQILRVAKAHHGRITAAEVLAETVLPLEEVTRTLDELAVGGTCQLVVGEKGTQVYYFPEFESDGAKEDALSDARPAQKPDALRNR